MAEFEPHRLRLLLTEAEIDSRVAEMGVAASKRYEGQFPIFLTVMDGAEKFAHGLEKAAKTSGLVFDHASITVKSMEGTESTGDHHVTKEYAGPDPEKRPLIIVEDIIDTGETLAFLSMYMEIYAPSVIGTIALFSKPERRLISTPTDDVGFEVAGFVVGYNLDWADRYRKRKGLSVVQFKPCNLTELWSYLFPKQAKRLKSVY